MDQTLKTPKTPIRIKQHKSKGEQFVNKVDLNKITSDFINFYYNCWITNVDALFAHQIWCAYTVVNIEGTKLNPQETVQYFKKFQGAQFKLDSYQFAPGGSRRIDIMSKGKMTMSGITKTIIQTFALIELKDTFKLKSTQIYFV